MVPGLSLQLSLYSTVMLHFASHHSELDLSTPSLELRSVPKKQLFQSPCFQVRQSPAAKHQSYLEEYSFEFANQQRSRVSDTKELNLGIGTTQEMGSEQNSNRKKSNVGHLQNSEIKKAKDSGKKEQNIRMLECIKDATHRIDNLIEKNLHLVNNNLAKKESQSKVLQSSRHIYVKETKAPYPVIELNLMEMNREQEKSLTRSEIKGPPCSKVKTTLVQREQSVGKSSLSHFTFCKDEAGRVKRKSKTRKRSKENREPSQRTGSKESRGTFRSFEAEEMRMSRSRLNRLLKK